VIPGTPWPHRDTFLRKASTFAPLSTLAPCLATLAAISNTLSCRGRDGIEPRCFVLRDQCFLPVLPSGGDGDCLAIILIENGSLMELGTASWTWRRAMTCRSARWSSVSLLARIGTAAYAEEVVRAFARIRDAYANSVRVVHGFPILIRGLDNETVIRSMLEIELWLSDCDKRRTHSIKVRPYR